MAIELTPEQAAAVAAAGGPVVVTDPRTGRAYRLAGEEEWRRAESALLFCDSESDDVYYEFPEPIRKARAAMRRDLPALLASWWTRGKWACYTAAGRVAIGRRYADMIDAVVRRSIPDGEYIIERIERGAVSRAEEWPPENG